METNFKVPIRNLFCLLSYANDMPELVESLNEVDEDITYDFIARRFLHEAERILLKNYVQVGDPTTYRRSKRMLMNDSISNKPVVICEKDEYSANILLNQVMKSTLLSLSTNRSLKAETRKRSLMLTEQLPEVDAPPLKKDTFARIRLTRHNDYYKRMTHIARMLHELTLLSHKQGHWSLFSANIDETSLNHLFEKFLFHFYRIEQKDYHVSSEVMRWQLEGNHTLLPTMKTDVSLTRRTKQEKIVIDVKLYKNMFQAFRGKASFHSRNMYQLFTYLMHQPQEMYIRGILIYPFNGTNVDESYRWGDRVTMEMMTINLSDSWHEIYRKLIGVVKN